MREFRLKRRRIATFVLTPALLVALVALGAVLAVDHVQFAPLASRAASRALGRKVAIDAVRVTLGRVVTVDVAGLAIANAPGASRPNMAQVAHLRAEIVPISLLRRDPVVRRLSADGVRLILEHGENDRPNWEFGGHAIAGSPSAAEQRASVPVLLDAGLADSEIDFRTSSGALLHFRLDKLAEHAAARDAPVTVTAEGAYNDSLPIRLGARLAPFAVLLDGDKSYGVDLRLGSGQTVIDFEGGMTDPLNFDGIEGRLVLNGPDPGSLPAIVQIPAALNVPVTFAAAASRHGNVWRLADGAGTFDGHPFQATIALREAPRRAPDSLTIDARFRTLDLGGVAPAKGSSAGSFPLTIDPAPGALVDAHIVADQVMRRRVSGHDLDLTLSLRPGVLTVGPVTLGIAGGVATSHTRVMNSPVGANGQAGADIMFDGGLTGVDALSLASLLGLGAIPLTGAIDSRFSGGASGTDLAAARNSSRGFAILSMAGGTIDRRLVELASTDIRALFGRRGAGKLTCLLAILNLRDGVGAIAPLRLKTPAGTITGGGAYDFRRDYIDMTIGSQSASTGFFALDIPVRISGPLSDYSVRPAIGRAARRLNADGDLGDMPAPMMEFARANPCMNARR
jgi:hypothetical protein